MNLSLAINFSRVIFFVVFSVSASGAWAEKAEIGSNSRSLVQEIFQETGMLISFLQEDYRFGGRGEARPVIIMYVDDVKLGSPADSWGVKPDTYLKIGTTRMLRDVAAPSDKDYLKNVARVSEKLLSDFIRKSLNPKRVTIGYFWSLEDVIDYSYSQNGQYGFRPPRDQKGTPFVIGKDVIESFWGIKLNNFGKITEVENDSIGQRFGFLTGDVFAGEDNVVDGSAEYYALRLSEIKPENIGPQRVPIFVNRNRRKLNLGDLSQERLVALNNTDLIAAGSPKEDDQAISFCTKDFSGAEGFQNNVFDSLGLKTKRVNDQDVIAEISNEFQNTAGLRKGDVLYPFVGDYNHANFARAFCTGRVSALAMFQRDGNFFEVILEPYKATLLDKYSVDFPANNPFKAGPGLGGKVVESVWDSEILARVFDGDHTDFSELEKATLIAMINVAVSHSSGAGSSDDKSIGLKNIYGKNASPCFPYGSKSFRYEVLEEQRDGTGNLLSQLSTGRGATIYFDPKFQKELLAEWKAGTGWGFNREIRALKSNSRFTCYSAEYRMLYNQMFQMKWGN